MSTRLLKRTLASLPTSDPAAAAASSGARGGGGQGKRDVLKARKELKKQRAQVQARAQLRERRATYYALTASGGTEEAAQRVAQVLGRVAKRR